MATLSSHLLNSVNGTHASGVKVIVNQISTSGERKIFLETETDSGGRILKDFELSQDIAQEAFIKAYKNIEKFRGDSQFYTWIYRIAINTAKNVVSTKARKSEIYDNDTTDQLLSESATTSENPENILQAEQLRSEINKALQNLPEDIRVTLSLREFDGLSYEEIAKVLECPIGTVRSRIHKGREMLDQTFSKYDMSNFEARKL